MDTSQQVTPSWCKPLRKIELHAHLSGSISADTIRNLLNKPENSRIRERASHLLDVQTGRTLKQCFDLFPIIHNLIEDTETLQAVVHNVLHDFASDNVIYLELRTTPRRTTRMTELDYLQTVLQAVHDFHAADETGFICRVLVSVSRHLPVQAAWQSVRVAERILNEEGSHLAHLLVGFELSGIPGKGCWGDFRPIFQYARGTLGLPVSLHFGEKEDEAECLEMLQFKPDRLGHAVIMSPRVLSQLLRTEPRIGVEVCITSNLKTTGIVHVADHPVVRDLIPAGYPFCICTDDSGVFETSVSRELALLATATQMGEEDVKSLIYRSVELAFCRDKDTMNMIKQRLRYT